MYKECAPLPQGTGGLCLLEPHWSTHNGSNLQNYVLGAGMRGNGMKISFRAWAFMCGRREAGGGAQS